MEKRAIIAAMLMAGLLMVYQMLFVNPEPQQKNNANTEVPVPSSAPAPKVTPAVPVTPMESVAPPERSAVVETPLYRAVVESRGGRLAAWTIDFRGEKPMVLAGVVSSEGLMVSRPEQPAKTIMFSLSADSIKLGKDKPEAALELTGDDGFGLRITQILVFRSDNYVVTRQIKVQNQHSVAQTASISLVWNTMAKWPEDQGNFAGPRPLYAIRLPRGAFWTTRQHLANAGDYVGDARWVGFESGVAPIVGTNGIYLTALIPKSAGIKVVEDRHEEVAAKGEKVLRAVDVGIKATLPLLQPGQAWDGQLMSYLGPMEYERLKALDVELEKAIYFGGFPFPEQWAAHYGIPTLPME